jgi:hypothetical protein
MNRKPWISLAWVDSIFPVDQDTISRVEPEKLQRIGEVIVNLLTAIVRETVY